MKNLFISTPPPSLVKNSLLILFFSIFFTFSCQKNEELVTAKAPDGMVTIGGLKAVLPEGYQAEDFKVPTVAEMERNVLARLKAGEALMRKARVKARPMSIDNESDREVYKFLIEEKKKMPELWNYPLKTKDIQRICRDFPSLKTEEDIRNNSDAVFEYYNSIAKKNTKNRFAPKGGRSLFITFFAVVALEVGLPILDAYFADLMAENDTMQRYGTQTQNGNVNIFQHSLWNCYSIRNMLITAISKPRAIELTALITNTYEYVTHGYSWFDVFQDDASIMDLKNNQAARSFMDEAVNWGIWVARSWPNRDEIKNIIGTNITDFPTGHLHLTSNEILNLFSCDPDCQKVVIRFPVNHATRHFVALQGVPHVEPLAYGSGGGGSGSEIVDPYPWAEQYQ